MEDIHETGNKRQTPFIYYLGLLLTTAIWASTFINIKIVLQQVPPNTLAFLRFFVASLVLGSLLVISRQPALKSEDLPTVALCGLTGITLYNFLQNQGLKFAGATDASILAAMAPVFIALIAGLVLKERITYLQTTGILIAFAGSVLVATNGSLSGLSFTSRRLAGDALILLTGISWAVYSISVKRLLEKYTATVVLAYSTFAGTIFLFPLSLFEYPVNLAAINLTGWLNILYLGVLASCLAYLIWNIALSRVAAVTAGIFLYLIPVFTAVIAAIFLREIPGAYTVIGGLIVLVGTYFAGK